MKKLAFILATSLLISQGGWSKAGPSALKDGTPLVLTTKEKMVSGEIPEGSKIKYRVERDVLDAQGRVLIASGATAYGKVVKSEGSGFFGRAGALNISVDNVDAADGSLVPLRAVRDETGDDQETGVIVGGVLLSVFFVFMEGDDVTIDQGTLITAFVDRDSPIAKPGAPKVSAAELKTPRSLTITSPTADSRVQKEDKMVVQTTLTPDDPEAIARLYLDGKLMRTQRGGVSRIEWDPRPFEKFTQEGNHTLEAEVTGSKGILVRSAPVKFFLKD
ncbi:MAG: hypothetical protein U0931_28290 [Vulcanimicrobiota bacterium]